MLTFLRKIRKSLVESGSEGRLSSLTQPNGILSGQAVRYLLYAIGEILLVMIGILLALQVNNWNQERMNEKKEILLLNEINKEFRYNREEMDVTIGAYKRIRRHCENIQKSFPIDPGKINRDTLANLLIRLRNLSSADISMGSIQTLINTSSFDIISNKELRSLLIQWEDLISDYFERETQAINYTRDYIIPYMATRVPQPYRVGIKDDRIDFSFLKTIEFENLINDRLNDSQTLLHVVESGQSKIAQALDRIIFLSSFPES